MRGKSIALITAALGLMGLSGQALAQKTSIEAIEEYREMLQDSVAATMLDHEQVQQRLHATRMKVMSRLLAGLQDAEREQLMDFMQRMLHSLQNPTDSHQV